MNKKNNKIVIPVLVLVSFVFGGVWTYLVINQLDTGKLKKILFCGTGALLSPTSTQQGLPIPGVCHAVCIEKGE